MRANQFHQLSFTRPCKKQCLFSGHRVVQNISPFFVHREPSIFGLYKTANDPAIQWYGLLVRVCCRYILPLPGHLYGYKSNLRILDNWPILYAKLSFMQFLSSVLHLTAILSYYTGSSYTCSLERGLRSGSNMTIHVFLRNFDCFDNSPVPTLQWGVEEGGRLMTLPDTYRGDPWTTGVTRDTKKMHYD